MKARTIFKAGYNGTAELAIHIPISKKFLEEVENNQAAAETIGDAARDAAMDAVLKAKPV